MKIKNFVLFAYFLVVGMSAGCVDHYVFVDKTSGVQELEAPAELFDHLSFTYIKQNDDGSTVCSYQNRTLALLSLKYTLRQYEYVLNEKGQIVRTELTECSWQPRLVPRFRLSDSFKEFE
jgi:hypothetical protein